MTNDSAYDDIITPIAAQVGVPVPLIKGIIAQESGFNPNATNLSGPDGARGGAFGLMQMTLTTATGMGFSGPDAGLLDPTTNLTLGIHFLSYCFEQADGNWAAAAACYNGGRAKGDGTFTDQAYVVAVLQYAEQYGGQAVTSSGESIDTVSGLPISNPAAAAPPDVGGATSDYIAAGVIAAIIAGLVILGVK
jgi:soluble lytic murein transglycosylase-like protein